MYLGSLSGSVAIVTSLKPDDSSSQLILYYQAEEFLTHFFTVNGGALHAIVWINIEDIEFLVLTRLMQTSQLRPQSLASCVKVLALRLL